MENKNDFTKLLPLLSGYVIFLGVLRLILFYGSFGVNIVSFLDFSEILTSFLDILIFTTVLVVFTIIPSFFTIDKEEIREKNSLIRFARRKSNFITRVKCYLIAHKSIYFNCFGFYFSTFLFQLIQFKFSLQPYLILTSLYFALLVYFIVYNEINRKHEVLKSSEPMKSFYSIIMLSILCLSWIFWQTHLEVKNIKEDKRFYGTTIEIENNNKIISDSSNYYIGKTKNYIFFYHEKNKVTDIIPASTIKMISIKTH